MSAWADHPTLVGRHVTLRPLRRDDAGGLVAAAAADGVWDMFYSGVAKLKDIDGWYAEVLAEQAYGRAMPFAVLDPHGQIIGTTRFSRMSERHRRVEIGGTFYARTAQRTGVNTEAKLLLLTHAFEVLGCNVVQIRTDWFNKRSQAAIERLGAKRDGVLRNHQLVDGRLRDIVVYSIIVGEWPGVRQNLRYLLSRYEEAI
jgi:N-acetyltransferase